MARLARPARTTWVLGWGDGRLLHDFGCRDVPFGEVTGVVEHAGRLYLGSP
ncbi:MULTISPECIES: hypothetical protein [unclassified Rhodococcus (in: high G+C Gram-positive bacteria)]|uniref:hypothetical protein n=1 Tax=unclassified Rhodococcus (in: high G+C Gram-positive bacteria) TaxID=192944 RepID=UPI001483BC83|nr:hypothetical protein [Rhodococcus sp. M8]QPG46214.1 hypothetical protein ISO16_03830 [Rhodococcus sp. M8]